MLGTQTLTQWTVVTGHLASWTTSLERDATDTTNIALTVVIWIIGACVPAPLSDGMPFLDLDFHGRVGRHTLGWRGGRREVVVEKRRC